MYYSPIYSSQDIQFFNLQSAITKENQMIRQLAVVLVAALCTTTSFAQSGNFAQIHLAQAQLTTYPILRAKLKASLDAIDAKLAEPNNAKLTNELYSSLSRINQLKASYFNSHDKKYLTAIVTEYKKVKFKLKPLTDSLAPLMEAPLDVLDTIKEYENPNLVVDWKEVESITAKYTKMIDDFANADSMVRSITENSDKYVEARLAEGESISISLYDEADRKAVEMYLNGR